MDQWMDSDSELLDCHSNNNLKDFMNIIKTYPIGNEESNSNLLKRYHSGDSSAKDLLVNTNLRLVVSQAYKQKNNAQSYELLDLIQEGTLGLIYAIDHYDENGGEAKFSTFATVCIKNSIRGALQDCDREIRRPAHIVVATQKYKKIVMECKKQQKQLPNDEELCKELQITENMLKNVKEDYKLDTYSLNDKILGEEEEKLELESIIPVEENPYDILLKEISDQQLLIVLKSYFPPFHYYVLYNCVIRAKKVKQHKIADEFFLTKQRISAIERKCLTSLKDLILKKGSISDWKLKPEWKENLNELNVEPVDYERIIQYFFFRDILEEEEKNLFKWLLTSIYKPSAERVSKELGISVSRYNELSISLKKKIQIQDKDFKEVYDCFKENIMRKYGSTIFTVDLDESLEDVVTNKKLVAKLWSGISYSDVTNIIKESSIDVSNHMEKLLLKYFDGKRYRSNKDSIQRAEREINSLLFGYHKKCELSLQGLYEVLEKNKNEFTEEQYMRLLRDKFHKISKRTYADKFPGSSLHDIRYLYHRLEGLYFNVHNYREFHFTKEKYVEIREQFSKKVSSEKGNVLDLYYGINCKNHSIQEIADKLGISYEEARVEVREIRNYAVNHYLDRNRSKTIEENNYIPYILDESIDLSEPIREMLRQFLIEKKSYHEIAELHSTTTRKVSINITTGLMKIDYYRFGIFKTETKYTPEELEYALLSSKLTKEELSVIRMKIEGKTRKEMMEKTGLDFQRIAYILNKFYKICCDNRIASVEIEESDIVREVTCHISERVLNENERLFLSELYGVECDLNPSGKKYTEKEFRLRHPEFSKKYKKILHSSLQTVRAKKAGQIRASLAYMQREELRKSLMDPRIPIDEKDRKLLNYSFELNGYPYKTLNELEEIFHSQAYSLKLKIQKAFVTIYKYENYEIPPSISFEYDVFPWLRYFSKSDQKILEDLYKNNLTYDEISKKNGLTKSQVESLVPKLDNHLRDLMDERVNGFDFNYFWAEIDKEDIPFYGDKQKAKRVFYLYYEERMTVSEIIEKLNLDCSPSVVSRTISNLMLAVLKRREGIKKVKTYSYEEIRDYYFENGQDMDMQQQEIYKKYFYSVKREQQDSSLSVLTHPNIPSAILLDMLKDKHEKIFSMENSTKEEVLQIIRKYENQLSSTTLNVLLNEFNISQRELMSGSEQAKVLRFLSSIKEKEKIMMIKKVA